MVRNPLPYHTHAWSTRKERLPFGLPETKHPLSVSVSFQILQVLTLSFPIPLICLDPDKDTGQHSQTTVRFHSPDLKDGLIPDLTSQSLAVSLWRYIYISRPHIIWEVLFIKICLWSFFPSTVLQLWVRKCCGKCSHNSLLKFKMGHI